MKVRDLVRKLKGFKDIQDYDVIFIDQIDSKLTKAACEPVIFDDTKQVFVRFIKEQVGDNHA